MIIQVSKQKQTMGQSGKNFWILWIRQVLYDLYEMAFSNSFRSRGLLTIFFFQMDHF